jgi:hypothetical protein
MLALITLHHDWSSLWDQSFHMAHTLPKGGDLLAYIPPGQDVLANIQNFWKDLLKSGKFAAGIVGFILGFLIKSITS